jgi:radical SAM superfamily enzyme YgiQ (UPF0313 family)
MDTTNISNTSRLIKHRQFTTATTSAADADMLVPQIRHKAVLIDLNNFATFPTLALGLLVASMRNSGLDVDVICPLAHDVPAAEREHKERLHHHWARRIRLSTGRAAKFGRELTRSARERWNGRIHRRVLAEATRALESRPDVLLLSAYLQHYHTVYRLGLLAKARGIPLVLGGPVFNHRITAEAWRTIPGLTAIIGAEVDLDLPKIISTVIQGGDLLQFGGVTLPDGRFSSAAAPMRKLDRVPVPDFTDFPWDRYRMRVLPIMTGRGCQWAKCTFCSDVVSVNGRTFRTRSVESIMHEVRELSRRHDSTNFIFLDLKLNSSPAVFRGIVENIQRNAPGAQWIGTVHVDQRSDNGLSRRDLREAVTAGMRRVSFGLESGSQELLDRMAKGCTVEANSEFIRNAHEAGLSVRCTMFKGYPGERANDLEQTADFLESHINFIDRIRFNELAILEGTPIYESLRKNPRTFPELKVLRSDNRHAKLRHDNVTAANKAYRKALKRVLESVFAINRRPVRSSASVFDGLM